MRIELTEYHEKAKCLWCSKDAPGVTATFDDEFLEGCLCWRCLAQAARVRFTQAGDKPPAKKQANPQRGTDDRRRYHRQGGGIGALRSTFISGM